MNASVEDRPPLAERLASVPNLVRRLMDASHERIRREIEEMQLVRLVAVRPIDEAAPDALVRAERRLAALPSWDTLRSWAKAIDAALEETPDEERTRVLIALLLDGFPKRVPAVETYLDAASAMLVDERFGPGIVASADHLRLYRGARTSAGDGDDRRRRHRHSRERYGSLYQSRRPRRGAQQMDSRARRSLASDRRPPPTHSA